MIERKIERKTECRDLKNTQSTLIMNQKTYFEEQTKGMAKGLLTKKIGMT
jgi:hypothetical protein